MITLSSVDIETIFELDASKVISDIIDDATAESIKMIKWLTPPYTTEQGKLKAVNQSFLLKINGKNVLIDTCVGNDRPRPGFPEWGNLKTQYLRNLRKVINPNEVDFVLCTHLHFDHIGWNTHLQDGKWQPLFPNAQYIFNKAELDYWLSSPKAEMKDDLDSISESIKPLIDNDLIKAVGVNEAILPGVKLIATPGHTPHHVAVLIEVENTSILFVGDVFHHPCQIAHPEWMSFDTDGKTAMASRKAILAEYADTDTYIVGSHFSKPAGGKIISTPNGHQLI